MGINGLVDSSDMFGVIHREFTEGIPFRVERVSNRGNVHKDMHSQKEKLKLCMFSTYIEIFRFCT